MFLANVRVNEYVLVTNIGYNKGIFMSDATSL